MPLTCLIVDLEGQEGGMESFKLPSNNACDDHPLNSPIRPVKTWTITIGAWPLQTFPLLSLLMSFSSK